MSWRRESYGSVIIVLVRDNESGITTPAEGNEEEEVDRVIERGVVWPTVFFGTTNKPAPLRRHTHGTRNFKIWIQILTLPFCIWVTFEKLPNF